MTTLRRMFSPVIYLYINRASYLGLFQPHRSNQCFVSIVVTHQPPPLAGLKKTPLNAPYPLTTVQALHTFEVIE